MSDPFLIPSIISGGISAAGNVAQGILNYFGQDKNRQMQIELANTAIQRRMSDLEKAGINPLMAGKIGGAETPTLQAPQMTGLDQAVNQITPNAIQKRSYELQQQQMQLSQTQAETERLKAEAAAKNADAAFTATQNSWYGKRTQQEMDVWGSTQRKQDAETTTINAMRDPSINKIKQEIALQAEQTTQTKTLREISEIQKKYADQTYGAMASKAVTEANQIATYFKQFFLQENQQKIDNQALSLKIMQSELGMKLIAQALEAKYGEAKYLTGMTDSFWKILSGAGQANNKSQGWTGVDLSPYKPKGGYQ